ncbi:MAG: hypothetical protein AAGF51_08735 [Pseudomonadota bacterium]
MTEIKLKSDRFQGLAAGEHAPRKTFWQSVLPFLFKPPKGPSALPTMSFEEGCYAVLYGAIMADDNHGALEQQALEKKLGNIAVFAEMSTEARDALHNAVMGKFHSVDDARRWAVVGVGCDVIRTKEGGDGPGRLARAMFGHAVDLVNSDNPINELELDFIRALGLRLRLQKLFIAELTAVVEAQWAMKKS